MILGLHVKIMILKHVKIRGVILHIRKKENGIRKLLICLLMIVIFISGSYAFSYNFLDWIPLLFDSSNSNYIDQNIVLPVLPSGLLDATGYHIDLGDWQTHSRSPYHHNFYDISQTSPFGDFTTVQANGGYLIQKRKATGEIIDTVAAKANVLEGGDLFWTISKTLNDKEKCWSSDIIFWNTDGPVASFHMFCNQVDKLSLMKRLSKSIVKYSRYLFNLRTKTLTEGSEVEIVFDDKYGVVPAYEKGVKLLGYEIIDLDNRITKVNVPYTHPEVKNDYIEFRKYQQTYSPKISGLEIIRLDRETFKENQHFIIKCPKEINQLTLQLVYKDLMIGECYFNKTSHWIAFDMKTGQLVWDKQFDYFKDNTYRMYELTPMIDYHYLLFREASFLEIYDLDKRDENGMLLKIHRLDVPVDEIFKSSGGKLYVSDVHGGKANISTYDQNLKPVGIDFCFDLERFTDYRGDGVISTRFGIDNDGVWVLWQDGQVRLRHFVKDNETPDIDIKLDIPEQIQAIAPAVWNDGKLYFCGIQRENSTGYLYLVDKTGTVKSFELEKIEYQRFSTNSIFGSGNISVNSKVIVVNIFGKHYLINKASDELKEIELKRSMALLTGDKFIGDLNQFGGIRVYDFGTMTEICTGILAGYDKQKIYMVNYEYFNGEHKNVLISLDVATGKVEKVEKEGLLLDNPGTTFKNAFLNTPCFQTYEGQPIQYSPLSSNGFTRVYSKVGNDLFTSDNQRVYKFSPCPTFSVRRTGDLEFELSMTRKDGKSQNFTGQAYLAQWGDDGKTPLVSKLDSPKIDIGNLATGQKTVIRFEPSDIGKSMETNGKYFALIIESNGLLDTQNSELSDFDKEGRPLFDGTSISYNEQKSVVVTVWENK